MILNTGYMTDEDVRRFNFDQDIYAEEFQFDVDLKTAAIGRGDGVSTIITEFKNE